MNDQHGTLLTIFKHLKQAMDPLKEELSTPERALSFATSLGIDLPAPPKSLISLKGNLTTLGDAYDALEYLLENGNEASAEAFLKLSSLSTTLAGLVQHILRLPTDLESEYQAYSDLLANVDFTDLGHRLFDFLVLNYLSQSLPSVYNALVLSGIFQVTFVEGDDLFIPPHNRFEIRYDLLKMLTSDPAVVAQEVYGWGTSELNAQEFLRRVHYLASSLGIRSDFYQPESSVESAISQSPEPIDPELRVTLYSSSGEVGTIESGLGLLGAPATSAGNDAGFLIYPFLEGISVINYDITSRLALTLSAGVSLSDGIGIEFRPQPTGTRIVTGLLTPNPSRSSSQLKVALVLNRDSESPILVAGQPGLSRIEATGFDLIAATSFAGSTDFNIEIELALRDGVLLIDVSKGDGFLHRVIPKDGIKVTFNFGVLWSNKKGLSFRGSAGFEVTLPVHADILGVLEIKSVYIALLAKTINNESLVEAVVTTTASLKLGLINANVERIGLISRLSFPSEGGNLGVANLELGFKPPDGAGLTIDSPAITGGGYLKFDQAKEEYAGILQLEIKGGIAIKAIGLLTTRLPGMPAGQKGFSLLLIITGEIPPVPLGFGFTLKGLGGLVGVNRTMELEVLRAGIKNRTLDSVMFPRDPVDNAQKIISDLQSVFPPKDGRFVFGPMAMLGWGTPPVLHIEIGLVLELPAPLRLAVMGKFSMVLPSMEVPKEAQVAVLRMDALGAIDFEKRDATVDATFIDSHVATFPITGDMAMRLNWGAGQAFILSAGGFNPRFQPPPQFPALGRLAIALATGDNPRIRLEAYLALTPATLQLGARLDLYAKAEVDLIAKKETFEATAFLGFDALAHFSPFSFIVDVNGQVMIKGAGQQLGASLNLTLSGPQPWHAHGKAVVDFLGKHELPVKLRIGEEKPPAPLPPGNPLEDLRTALKDARNWSAQLPADGHMVVTLRRIPVSETTVLMHPFGELSFRQKVVPLNHRLAKYGNTRPLNPGPFSITSVRLGQITRTTPNTVRDLFAPGQFFEFSDEEKLSRPAFDLLPSGFSSLSSSDFMFPANEQTLISTNIEYDTVIIDNKEELASRREPNSYAVAADLLHIMAGLGAAGQAPMLSTGAARFAGTAANRVQVKAPEYVVAGKAQLQGQSFAPSYTEATAAKNAMGAAGKNYQIVEKHEIE